MVFWKYGNAWKQGVERFYLSSVWYNLSEVFHSGGTEQESPLCMDRRPNFNHVINALTFWGRLIPYFDRFLPSRIGGLRFCSRLFIARLYCRKASYWRLTLPILILSCRSPEKHSRHLQILLIVEVLSYALKRANLQKAERWQEQRTHFRPDWVHSNPLESIHKRCVLMSILQIWSALQSSIKTTDTLT